MFTLVQQEDCHRWVHALTVGKAASQGLLTCQSCLLKVALI